jgi:hypothetical protein
VTTPTAAATDLTPSAGDDGAEAFRFNRFFPAGIHRVTDFAIGVDDIRIAGFGTNQAAANAFPHFSDPPGGARASVGNFVNVGRLDADQMTKDKLSFIYAV